MTKRKNKKDSKRIRIDNRELKISKKKFNQIIDDGYYYLHYNYRTTDGQVILLRNYYVYDSNENCLLFESKEVVDAPKELKEKIMIHKKIGKLECVAKQKKVFGYDKNRIKMINNIKGFYWGQIVKVI